MTEIKDYALIRCSRLKHITIPHLVTNIGTILLKMCNIASSFKSIKLEFKNRDVKILLQYSSRNFYWILLNIINFIYERNYFFIKSNQYFKMNE